MVYYYRSTHQLGVLGTFSNRQAVNFKIPWNAGGFLIIALQRVIQRCLHATLIVLSFMLINKVCFFDPWKLLSTSRFVTSSEYLTASSPFLILFLSLLLHKCYINCIPSSTDQRTHFEIHLPFNSNHLKCRNHLKVNAITEMFMKIWIYCTQLTLRSDMFGSNCEDKKDETEERNNLWSHYHLFLSPDLA